VFLEIAADLQAATTFVPALNDERNGSRHGNALCTEFDERLDIIPRTVQMNVSMGILDASSASKNSHEIKVADAAVRWAVWFSPFSLEKVSANLRS